MRILFITPHVPSAERVRQREFVRHLALRGHDLTLLVLSRPGERLEPLAEARRWCRDVVLVSVSRRDALAGCLRSLVRDLPLNVAFFESAQARAALRRLDPDRFDVAHLDLLRTAPYAPLLGAVKRIFDANDSMTLLWSRTLREGRGRTRLLGAWEYWKTRRYERRALAGMDAVVATSTLDTQALAALAPNRPVWKIANGVDTQYFRPAVAPDAPPTLVFLGRMGYHANVASVLFFARQVMPRLWRERPDVRFLVVGADPRREVQRLAADPRITVTGYVADVRPHLARASVGVCPIVYGAGIQNKVLEFMASGLPVVASPRAASGLRARAGQELLVADSPGEWVEQVGCLLGSSRQRRALGDAGRAYVTRHHSWTHAAAQLEAVYGAVAPSTVAAVEAMAA